MSEQDTSKERFAFRDDPEAIRGIGQRSRSKGVSCFIEMHNSMLSAADEIERLQKRIRELEACSGHEPRRCREHLGTPHPACPLCNPDKTVPELNRAAPPPRDSHFGWVNAIAVADGVFEQYKRDHPKWWKRMDGTPILNDIAVRMAQAFLEATQSPTATKVCEHPSGVRGAYCNKCGEQF
jgi:hypothetical protein